MEFQILMPMLKFSFCKTKCHAIFNVKFSIWLLIGYCVKFFTIIKTLSFIIFENLEFAFYNSKLKTLRGNQDIVLRITLYIAVQDTTICQLYHFLHFFVLNIALILSFTLVMVLHVGFDFPFSSFLYISVVIDY